MPYDEKWVKEYKGCPNCTPEGPFEPELFRHSMMADRGTTFIEAIPRLMRWVSDHGFCPESISFYKEPESHVGEDGVLYEYNIFVVRLVTRFVSFHSGWYNHMRDPERKAWSQNRDRPIMEDQYGRVL